MPWATSMCAAAMRTRGRRNNALGSPWHRSRHHFRSLGGSVSNQGLWDLNISYDELRHNISDTYQTPQQGKMGGNNFTLPTSFGTINANNATPSARVLNPTQLGAFHTEQVGTTRKNTSFGAGYAFSPALSLKFDFNHLDQSAPSSSAPGRRAELL